MSGLSLEKRFPLALASVSLLLCVLFGNSLAGWVASGTIVMDGLYGALFDWSAIQTAFAFGVFAFIMGHSGDFIMRLRATKAFKVFANYVFSAMASGFVLSVASLPLLVTQPKDIEAFSAIFYLISIWFSLFMYCIASFYRVGRIMWIIVRTQDNREHPG